MTNQFEVATFGAGCFWGTEAAFQKMKGITKTEVGYMGGTLDDPMYEDVIGHDTGHAEVVQVAFDPAVLKYNDLLDLFWFMHDPTQLNRQGNDIGDEYRSVIFCHSDEQKKSAEASKQALVDSGKYDKPIITAIEPAAKLWTAEEYHQKYLDKNPGGYCHVNLPAVADFLKKKNQLTA